MRFITPRLCALLPGSGLDLGSERYGYASGTFYFSLLGSSECKRSFSKGEIILNPDIVTPTMS